MKQVRPAAFDLLRFSRRKGTARGPVIGCARVPDTCLGIRTTAADLPSNEPAERDEEASRRSRAPWGGCDEQAFAVRLLAAESGRCVRDPRRQRESGLGSDAD